MSVVVYIGKYRSRCGIDSGAALVRDLRASGVDISAVLVNADDPLGDELRPTCNVIELPPLLSLPRATIQARLTEPSDRAAITILSRRLQELRPQAGLLYYGSWLPPEITAIPSLGFLNFHPAPLPYLRGFECNTFAILRGCARFHATVHAVSEDYDDGAVYAVSPVEELDAWCVPPELLARVDRYAPEVLAEGLANFMRGRTVISTACVGGQSVAADRKNLLAESKIDWESDSLVDIWRRFRAFCGQRTGLRLRAVLNGSLQYIDDLMILGSAPGASAGTITGTIRGSAEWEGCPIVCCNGGEIALRPGGPAPQTPSFKEGHPAALMNRDLLRERCLIAIGL